MKAATHFICVTLAAAVIGAASVGTAAAGELPQGVDLRAYLNDSCVVSDEPYLQPPSESAQIARSLPFPAGIVGKLIETLIRGVVRATATRLDSAAQHKDFFYVSAYDFDLYRATVDGVPARALNPRLDCITVVAAQFEPDGTDCTDRYQPKLIDPASVADNGDTAAAIREDDSVENILRRANICVDGRAHSIYEGQFEFSDDATAFRIETQGFWLNSLISTNSRKARRSVIYTFDIAEPGLGSKPRSLLSAAVPIGTVTPGTALLDEDATTRSEWLQVPALSGQASQAFTRDTAAHSDVLAAIKSLERSITQNRRLLDGLKRRLDGTSDAVRQSMQKEIATVEFKLLRMESLLEARQAEYEELPDLDGRYMPVTVGVGVIESRSEKRATRVLAAFLDEHRAVIADTAASAAGIERSLDLDVANTGPETALATTRTAYFDAVAALEEARAVDETDLVALEERLKRAKSDFNAARNDAGLSAIE